MPLSVVKILVAAENDSFSSLATVQLAVSQGLPETHPRLLRHVLLPMSGQVARYWTAITQA